MDFSNYSEEEQEAIAVTAQGAMAMMIVGPLGLFFQSTVYIAAAGATMVWVLLGIALFIARRRRQ